MKNLIKIIFISVMSTFCFNLFASSSIDLTNDNFSESNQYLSIKTTTESEEKSIIDGIEFNCSSKPGLYVEIKDLQPTQSPFFRDFYILKEALKQREVDPESYELIANQIGCFLKDNLDNQDFNNSIYKVIMNLEKDKFRNIFETNRKQSLNNEELKNYCKDLNNQKLYIDHLLQQENAYNLINQLMKDTHAYLYEDSSFTESTSRKRKRDDSNDSNQFDSDTEDSDSNDEQDLSSNDESFASECFEIKSSKNEPTKQCFKKKAQTRNLNTPTYKTLKIYIEKEYSKETIIRKLDITPSTFRIYCGNLLKNGTIDSSQLQYLKKNIGRIGRNGETRAITLEWLNKAMSEETLKPDKSNNVQNTLYPHFLKTWRLYFECDLTLKGFRRLMHYSILNQHINKDQINFYNSFKKGRNG